MSLLERLRTESERLKKTQQVSIGYLLEDAKDEIGVLLRQVHFLQQQLQEKHPNVR